eukprot:gene259-6674_t
MKEIVPSNFSTVCVHGDDDIEDTSDVSAPLHLSVTFVNNSDQNIYARSSTSTRKRVEELLGRICHGNASIYSSGQAALFSIIKMLKPKRVVLAAKGGYHGSKILFQQFEEIHVVKGLKDVELKKGDLLYLESPLNPTVDLFDIKTLSKEAHEKGALVLVDSTIGPPPLTFPIKLGADFVYYSATKYLGGHSDLLLGVIVTKETKFHMKLLSERTTFGNVPGSLDTWLLLRSLRTLDLRVKKQSQNSIKLAKWLSNRSEVEKIWHTSLLDHPSYELVKEQFECGEHPPLIAIELFSENYAKLLPEVCKVFKNATSLGSIESLIEWRFKHDYSLSKKLLRISVGIEDVNDLIKDLENGFDILRDKFKDSSELVSNFNSKISIENMCRLKYSLECLEELKSERIITEKQFKKEKDILFIKHDILDENQVKKFSISELVTKKKFFEVENKPREPENHAISIFMFFLGVIFFLYLFIFREVIFKKFNLFKKIWSY